MKYLLPVALLPLVAACATTPQTGGGPARPGTPATTAPQTTTPPPMTQPPTRPATGGFRAPKVMASAGLEGVIGRNETAIVNLFGTPRLVVKEGDARKLQFTGNACVLDIFLYPLSQGAEPTATYVEARRASDGLDVDRVACVAALKR